MADDNYDDPCIKYNIDFRGGIVTVHKPHGRASGRIFAFHGPEKQASWRASWNYVFDLDSGIPCHPTEDPRSRPDRTESVFWLRELLPKEFPHCAIYSVGYYDPWYWDLDGWSQTPSNMIHDHLEQTPFDERAPIAFIAHGLGGLCLKAVIRDIWGNKGSFRSHTPQLDQLRGVIFLGTPQKNIPTPKQCKSLFPDEALWPLRDVDDETWEAQAKSLTDDFRDLVQSNGVKIISVSEMPSPSAISSIEDTRLDTGVETMSLETTTYFWLPQFENAEDKRFHKMCNWLCDVFQKKGFRGMDMFYYYCPTEQTQGSNPTELLSRDSNWEWVLYYLRPRRPFDLTVNTTIDKFLGTRFGKDLIELQTSSISPGTDGSSHNSCDFWVHLPANNESWMTRAQRSISPATENTKIPASLDNIFRAQSDVPHSRYALPNFEAFEFIFTPKDQKVSGKVLWKPLESMELRLGAGKKDGAAGSIRQESTDEQQAVKEQKLEMKEDVVDVRSQGNGEDHYDYRLHCVRIFLPYLHWDTAASARVYNNDVNSRYRFAFDSDDRDLSRHARATGQQPPVTEIPTLSTLFKEEFNMYHPRRTLDQFYYSRTADTSQRDADQVVYRITRPDDDAISGEEVIPGDDTISSNDEKSNDETRSGNDAIQSDQAVPNNEATTSDKSEELDNELDPDLELPGEGKIIMVDQLWLSLWIVERRHHLSDEWEYVSSAVLTAFPSTSYPRSDKDPPRSFRRADLRQSIIQKLESQRIGQDPVTASQLAPLILSTAVFEMLTLPGNENWSLYFLGLFRETIGEIANSYDHFSREFVQAMASNTGIGVDQRRREVRLSIEISDVIDELHMLKKLVETQMGVLSRGYEKCQGVPCLSSLEAETISIRRKLKDVYLPEIQAMIEDSQRLQKNMMNLLDLQQKEESIYQTQRASQQTLFTAKQALSAQVHADTTKAQSHILFAFTAVTIVFLPLSFFTSYFSMFKIYVSESIEASFTLAYVLDAIWGVSGPIIATFLIGAGFFYMVSKRNSAEHRATELLKLKREGYIPENLITDEEFERMQDDLDRADQRKRYISNYFARIWRSKRPATTASRSATRSAASIVPSKDGERSLAEISDKSRCTIRSGVSIAPSTHEEMPTFGFDDDNINRSRCTTRSAAPVLTSTDGQILMADTVEASLKSGRSRRQRVQWPGDSV